MVNILENIVEKEAEKEKQTFHMARRSEPTLRKQQAEGRRSLKAWEKAGEIDIVGLDKSGKRDAMDRNLYIELMEPHIRGDSIHTREEVDAQENHFNGAAKRILRAFSFGEDWGHEDRLKSAYTASHNQVPSLNQLVKDHKDTLKTRPVCRAQASQAPNGPLGDLVGEILNHFIEATDSQARTDVVSTEEL